MLTVLGGLAEFERELIRVRNRRTPRARQGARRPHGQLLHVDTSRQV